jgi:hypothetical protein
MDFSIEYWSVCPSSEMSPSTPSTATECVPPLGPKGGVQYSLAVEGVGYPYSDDWPESLHGTLYTLWQAVDTTYDPSLNG